LHSWLDSSVNGLIHRPLWQPPRFGQNIIARVYGDGWLITELNSNALIIKIINANGVTVKSNIVAKDGSCGRLDLGFPIRREDGGFWLVGPYGCQINLSKDLKRLDPYSISDHLRSRGSISLSRNERIHMSKLIWVLAGLPFSLLIFYGIARWRKKTAVWAITTTTVFYSSTASILLYQLWPLLR